MTTAALEPTSPALSLTEPSPSIVKLKPRASQRLQDRLAWLDVAAIYVDARGSVTAANQPAWLVEQIIHSPAFTAMIAEHRHDLLDADTAAVSVGRNSSCSWIEPWPGLHLLPLVCSTARASQPRFDDQEHPPIMLALVLGSHFVETDQFHTICNQRRLNRQSVLSNQDPQLFRNARQIQELTRTISWLAEDAAELERTRSELESMTEELGESYEELSLLYKLSTSMTVTQWAGEFLRQACSELRQVLGLGWLCVKLIDDDPRLEDLAGEHFVDGQPRLSDGPLADLGQTLLERYGKTLGPTLIHDMDELELTPRPNVSGKLLVAPLQREGRTYGVLYGAEKTNGSVLSSVDTNLVSTLGGSLTIFLENRAVYEDSQAMFMGTLHALTSAIDAKDSYTHGHSERVALVSRMLAQAVGLDSQTVKRVYLAGLVHDVGKIGVPEAVLTKPGRLTDEEFAHIKRHPEVGLRILEDIRQMQDLLPGVMHHHERWDGRGYPHNLAGYDIPLFGRLLGLADAFDAMSSDRTYRSRMTREQVLEEIERCRGSQFDAEMADTFLRMDFSAYDLLIDKHAGTPTPMSKARQPG